MSNSVFGTGCITPGNIVASQSVHHLYRHGAFYWQIILPVTILILWTAKNHIRYIYT